MLVKFLSPRRARIREQNIHMIRVLLHLLDQSLDFARLCDIRRDRDGFAVGVGEGVEGCDGFFAGFGFARGDEDFGAAGLGEAVVFGQVRSGYE